MNSQMTAHIIPAKNPADSPSTATKADSFQVMRLQNNLSGMEDDNYIDVCLNDVSPFPLRPRTYVYILKLEKNKWYVGYTKTTTSRLRNHFDGGGAKWTRKYKPVALAEIIYGNKKLEQEITIRMMMKFGMSNVRGSHWCHTKCDIPKIEKRRIRKLMKRYKS